MKKIYATCTLCQHFDANRNVCSLIKDEVDPMDYVQPQNCQKEGRFMRNVNVIPDSYHYYKDMEDIPFGWQADLSRLPKDEYGVPLFVYTKRGIERAIPADPSVTLVGDILVGVEKILTYQGQRELLFDLGMEIAQIEAKRAGVHLTILPNEVDSPGIDEKKKAYWHNQGRYHNPKNQWMCEEPIESW